MTDKHPWQSAFDSFNDYTLPFLTEHGKTIGKKATESKDIICIKIMKYYTLLHKSFDPMTLILLDEAIKEYKIC